MIRKQLYIAIDQERKLRELAERWSCTEAHVLRLALDRLAEDDETLEGRLAAAGLLVTRGPNDDDLPTDRDVDALEEEYDAWARSRSAPVGLTAAVLEDRR
jgi:hypothetical protein